MARPTTPRPLTEREIWQRIQRQGKTSFFIRSTLAIGGLLFLLTGLAERYLKNVRLSYLDLTEAACLCALIGFFCAYLLWQRGEEIVAQPRRSSQRRR